MSGRSWFLSITSYRGWTPGASHYYGTILPDDAIAPAIELFRPVTQADLADGDFDGYRRGDDTNRFDSWEHLLDVARATFQEIAEPGDELYRGAPYLVDRELLWAKPAAQVTA
jgi:hypothetical protein